MKIVALILLSITILLCFSSCNDPSKIDYDKILDGRPIIIEETEEETAPPIYTISFKTNGGTEIDPIQTNTLSNPPTPEKKGYNFNGWYLDPELSQPVNFPITIIENVTLYAKWDIKKYMITFQSNGGTYIDPIITDVLTSAPTPTKDRHSFEGWYKDISLTNKAYFPIKMSEGMTLYAKWLMISDTASFDDLKIKDGKGYYSEECINIKPKTLDLKTLNQKGYNIRFIITYDVKYKKDYDVLFDIGYFGAPEYELYLFVANKNVYEEEKVKAPSATSQRTITYEAKISEIMNTPIEFCVSTDNIQNIVQFRNIKVKYECYK